MSDLILAKAISNMPTTFYHLSTCSTCKRIASELKIPEGTKVQNLKEEHLTEQEIDQLKEKVGTYEALFNRRSKEYRGRGLHEKELSETDYKSLLLDHYSFVKRPILIHDGMAFIGNGKKTIAAAKTALD